ncbi:MAG: PorV/PorQ family protein [Elusimicrobia bacterium]|nr:PorV/PorQ family protein [Elusimicrobiota bacterium]
MKNKIITFIIFILLSFSTAYGGGGTYIFPMLRIPAGASASAIGNAGTAVSGAPIALSFNPAGLSGANNYQLATTQSLWIESMHYSNYMLAGPFLSGYLGLGFTRLSAGSIKRFDFEGLPVKGYYNPTDFAISAGYAYDFGPLSLGLAVKYLSSEIAGHRAEAFATDSGLLLKTPLIDLGFSVQNLGSGASYRKEIENLPLVYRGGISKKITFNKISYLLAFDAEFPDNLAEKYGGGLRGEFALGQAVISLMGGLQSDTSGKGSLSALTWGFGLRDANIGFDYSASFFGDLGLAHKISVDYRFSSRSGSSLSKRGGI